MLFVCTCLHENFSICTYLQQPRTPFPFDGTTTINCHSFLNSLSGRSQLSFVWRAKGQLFPLSYTIAVLYCYIAMKASYWCVSLLSWCLGAVVWCFDFSSLLGQLGLNELLLHFSYGLKLLIDLAGFQEHCSLETSKNAVYAQYRNLARQLHYVLERLWYPFARKHANLYCLWFLYLAFTS